MKWLIQLHQYLNKEFSCTCLFCLCSASLMVKNIIFSREVLVFTLWCMLHNHQVCFSSRQWAVFHPLQRRAWLFPLLSRFESETGREEEGGGYVKFWDIQWDLLYVSAGEHRSLWQHQWSPEDSIKNHMGSLTVCDGNLLQLTNATRVIENTWVR